MTDFIISVLGNTLVLLITLGKMLNIKLTTKAQSSVCEWLLHLISRWHIRWYSLLPVYGLVCLKPMASVVKQFAKSGRRKMHNIL